MVKKQLAVVTAACSILFTGIGMVLPGMSVPTAQAAGYAFTYKVPANLEKYLSVNRNMVSIQNPQPKELAAKHRYGSYLIDRDGGYFSEKTMYMNEVHFRTSKKGFLLDVFHWIGILSPVYREGIDLIELDKQINQEQAKQDPTNPYSGRWSELLQKRGQINLQARLQALINAGYVTPEEIDDEPATKQFVANVLYRMFQDVRPYKGSVKLQDTDDVALLWAVETGLPGFEADGKGNIYPNTRLRQTAGPEDLVEEYTYSRLFDFITLILPGKKTANGWEYYQVQLLPKMVPVRAEEFIYVNGKPFRQAVTSNWNFYSMAGFYQTNRQIASLVTPRFEQMLKTARQDALKPRAWDWKRDLVSHPLFAHEVALYRKTKSPQALNAVYQKVRNHYNLYLRQDSPAVIKSVLDHVK
ncbi:hypothetical protein [Brevibacillus sp. H7]|uniref:hypothetical protein n=1 Tax=Brevibacillus sp. H7 TaxID=3349138 RepID=UPI00380E838F